MKYNTYTLVRVNGKVERCKVPTFFDPYTVAERLPHTLVFMDVPKGKHVPAYRLDVSLSDCQWIAGPEVVLIHNTLYYWMPHAPKDEIDASRLWRNYGPNIYAKAECRRQLATA